MDNSKCWWGYGESETLLLQLLWQTVWQFLKTVGIVNIWHNNSVPGVYPRERKVCVPSKTCLQDFHGSSVVNNLPANAGDPGLTPGLGRSHMVWGN